MRAPPAAASRMASSLVPGKAKGKPSLRIMVHEDAREISLDPNELIANSVAAIDLSHQSLKVIVGDRSLIFLQQFPLRRIGQRTTEEIDCKRRKRSEEEEEEGEEGEAEDPGVKMMRDHRLDFRLFNTMLAGC